jgi:dienelactone hydrolase
MRALELLVAVLFVLASVAWFFGMFRKRPVSVVVPLLLIAAGFAQIAVEDSRWQLIPLYGLAIILIFVAAFHLLARALGREPKKNTLVQVLAVVARVLYVPVFLAALALPALLPVPELRQPNGNFPTGTYELRPDVPGADSTMLRFWYPAASGSAEVPAENPLLLAPGTHAAAYGLLTNAPPFAFGHLRLARASSLELVAVSEVAPRYPLVLLVADAYETPIHYVELAEQLASEGYVVAGLFLPDHSLVLPYEDARPVLRELPDQPAETGFLADSVAIPRLPVGLSDEPRETSVEALSATINAVVENRLRLGLLDGRIDTSFVGLVGAGVGAALTEQAVARTSIDGGLVVVPGPVGGAPEVSGNAMQLLGLCSSAASCSNLPESAYGLQLSGGELVPSSISRIAPVLFRLEAGEVLSPEVSHDRNIAVAAAYLTAFFDRYVRGDDPFLLRGARARYPDAVFTAPGTRAAEDP